MITKKNFKMIIMMIILSVSFSSCMKDDFETINEQIKTETTKQKEKKQSDELRSLKPENALTGFYEVSVDIEDFKNVVVEDSLTYKKHTEALEKLKKIDVFPTIKQGYNLENLSSGLEDYNRFPYNCYNSDWYHFGISLDSPRDNMILLNHFDIFNKSQVYVEIFLKRDHKRNVWLLMTPKESYETFDYDFRKKLIRETRTKDYLRTEIPLQEYHRVTGIDTMIIKNLRILTRSYHDKFDSDYMQYSDQVNYYYQFPFKDNYKDYQSKKKFVEDLNDLKILIQPGSVIFVSEKNRPEGHWNHSIVVSDYWYDLPDEMNSSNIKSDSISQYGYQSIDKYKRLKKGEKFSDIYELRKDILDRYVSFNDYLKRFVLIEAKKDDSENENSIGSFKKHKGIQLTSGNDKRIQNQIMNDYTVIAISNLNYGYQLSHQDLVHKFNVRMKNCLEYDYGLAFFNLNNNFEDSKHYCSGLVYYSYTSDGNSLKILLEKHLGLFRDFSFYFPMTLTNSPYFDTKIWLR